MSIVTQESNNNQLLSRPLRAQGKQRSLSILFWGTESLFSAQVLSQLAATVALSAVMLPGSPEQRQAVQQLQAEKPRTNTDELLLATPFVTPTTLHSAWQHGLPVYGIRTLHANTVRALLQMLAPDLVCVACFPWRIPSHLLAIPTFGFVNLHPSLLPAYRGPAPLFWQLRAGVQTSGVTLHRMDRALDTGDIIEQQSLPLAEGASGAALDHAYAQLGATMVLTFLNDLAQSGTVHSQPQATEGSTQSWPQATDFSLDLEWSARHAFNFMRGTAEWGQPYQVTLQGQPYRLTHALSYAPAATLPTAATFGGTELAIQFNPGVLHATTDS